MMNSNDQPPSPTPLDFEPRRANDRVMLSRLANVETELTAVRMTVEVIRSNYATREDLVSEVGKVNGAIAHEIARVNEKLAAANENTAREFSKVNEAIAQANAGTAREFGKVYEGLAKAYDNTNSLRAEMHMEFTLQAWRVVGTMIVVCSALTAAVYCIARNIH